MHKFFILLLGSFSVFAQTTVWVPNNSFTQNCEGPAFDFKGNLYVVNYQKDGTIAKFNPKGQLIKILELPKGSIGNGIRFRNKYTAFVVDFAGHNVFKLNAKKMTVSIHCHNESMNQPNDLTISPDGTIYCSDPKWAKSNGQVWQVNTDGTSKLVAENMGTTNGIEVDPSGKLLYVNESVQRNVWVFDILPDHALVNKRLFHHFDQGGMDGMRCDRLGNLYITRWGSGQVDVLNPHGQLIKTIKTMGKSTSNIAFGGKDGKQVVVTLQDTKGVETFFNEISGQEFVRMHK